MDKRESVERAIQECVERLDRVLNPLRFEFESEGIQSSHERPFASGHYVRAETRIAIACRESLDSLAGLGFEHSFVTPQASSTRVETFVIGYEKLMDLLGHAADCHLVASGNRWVARDGGNAVAAFAADVSTHLQSVLADGSSEFETVIRQGARSYSTR